LSIISLDIFMRLVCLVFVSFLSVTIVVSSKTVYLKQFIKTAKIEETIMMQSAIALHPQTSEISAVIAQNHNYCKLVMTLCFWFCAITNNI